jgi:membrane fusion protein (multidrug efflux system)
MASNGSHAPWGSSLMRSRSTGWTVWRCGAATVIAAAGCSGRAEPPPKAEPPKVTVVSVRKTNVPIVVHTQGTTRAMNDVTIRARVKGFLQGEPRFAEGTDVKAGQLLLVIEEEPYQIKLEQARATLAESEASLKQAEQSKAREVAQAQLHLDEAQETLDQLEERRERSLLARNAGTIEDVERRQAVLKKSTAQVEADRANLEQTKADYETNILAARAKVVEARAAVRNAEIDLGYCRMVAPIDGRIGQLLIKPGNLVGPDKNTDLATIQQLDPMGVDLNPPARRLPLILELMKTDRYLTLIVEGEREHPHPGKFYFMDNAVEPTTGTFLMKASVPNPDKNLFPGEYARVRIEIGEYRDVITVPEKAVIAEGQEGTIVYVLGASGEVEARPVKAIDTYRGMKVIESGLEPGQKVIVDRLQFVRRGMKVTPDEAPLDRFLREDTESDQDERFETPAYRARSSSATGDGGRPEAPAKESPAAPR